MFTSPLIAILTIVFNLLSRTQGQEQVLPGVSSYYGLPLLFPYGNCSWQLNTQTLDLYLTHMLQTKTRAQVYQMNNVYQAAPQRNIQEVIDDVAVKTMLATDSEATEFNQCMDYYCYERTTPTSVSNGICNQMYIDQITGILTIFFPLNDPSTFQFAVQKEPNFVHVLSQLPLPSVIHRHNGHYYTYYTIYGNRLQRQDYTVDSIAIMATSRANFTQITLELTANVHVYWNKELLSPNEISSNQFTLKQGHVMWLENTQEVKWQTLSLSKITSTQQLAVYTAAAKPAATFSFSYATHLLYQMPDTREWGKKFMVDLKHLELLLLQNNEIITSLRILAVNDTKVKVMSYADQLQTSYREIKLGAEELRDILITHELNTHPTHMIIQGTRDILILYEAYTTLKGHNKTYFSYLLQPVEWFTFRQSVILSSPWETHDNQSYRIALVCNKHHGIKVHTDNENPVNIYNYEKFEQIQLIDTEEYDLYHIQVRLNVSMEKGDTMLIFTSRDSNKCRSKIGASLFSFSNMTSYTHSNSYVLDDTIIKNSSELCRTRRENNLVVVSSSISTTTVLIVILITLTIIVVVSMKPKILFQKKDPPPQDFKFDIFLSFADEDKVFVRECLYEPLKCKGYQVFWHLSDFIAGITIAENMLKAIGECRWIIFVCSEHFARSDFCQQELKFGLDSHYNKYQGKYRRVIPLVIQKGSCPRTLMQLKPINLMMKEGPTPNKKKIQDIIRVLNFGKSLKGLKKERDVKERQKHRQTMNKVAVRWDKNNEDSVFLLSSTSDSV